MIHGIPLEFFVAVLFIIDVCLILLLVLFARRVRQLGIALLGAQDERNSIDVSETARQTGKEAAKEVMELLTPLLEDARDTAGEFDSLVRDKKRILKQVNEALDSRIISLNLLLSRADRLQHKLEEQQQHLLEAKAQPRFTQMPQPASPPQDVLTQQKQIIDLYFQRTDVDTIAERLSIPKGEVQLVIDLKEKFLAMEQVK